MTDADWKNPGTSSLALHLSGAGREAVDEEGRRLSDDDLLVVLNASDTELDFVLPSRSERGRGPRWHLVLDTAVDGAREEVTPDSPTHLTARSLKVFSRRALAPSGTATGYGVPSSTYRLQLTPTFGFRDAQAITQYLEDLGIGGIYASPILRPRAGSMHGYDVVDHASLNPELGSSEDFSAWVGALRERRIERLVDFVPNHVGVGGGENAWWNDVLEHGPSSLFADYFDIDWTPPTGALESKVLLPVLGGQFGEELEAKKISVVRRNGALFVMYGSSSFPASPRSHRLVLEAAVARLPKETDRDCRDELESVTSALRHLPPAASSAPNDREARAREAAVTKRRLGALTANCKEVAEAIDASLAALNENADKLDAFLLEQNFRLASWRVAGDEINYRRFFDLNDLAAIRMEDPRVFDATHALILDLVKKGEISGLRLDHTDGLYDPEAYFVALRNAAGRALEAGGLGNKAPFYVVAEKILEAGEELPGSWAIAGTTGYDFLSAVNGLWVDPEARGAFDEEFASFAGVAVGYESLVYDAKAAILRSGVSSEVQMLAHLLKRIADGQRRARDFTFTTLVSAISETLRSFPVYRAYVRPDGSRQPNDEAHVRRAFRVAQRRNPLIDRSVFDFLGSILLLRNRSEENVRFAMRFQQLTGPVMAKGVEDTATYRYPRLLSNNEVGCDPGRFATSPERFHEHNVAMLARWPLSMTATTTHDTKLSEDVRARLAVLSEVPDEWRAAVSRFHEMVQGHIGEVDGEPAPSRLDEYLFFQVAFGAYPYGGLTGDEAKKAFTARLAAYMNKASHEAKLSTSWLASNAAYDAALQQFVESALGNEKFFGALGEFVADVAPQGATNSLAQLALRLGAPGIPDIYQGTELWDDSLVDPDNRRPVDFEARKAALAALVQRGAPSPELAAKLVSSYSDGRIKMHLLRTALRLRRTSTELFLEGAYRPLPTEPQAFPSVVAFERTLAGARLAVVAPRLTRRVVKKGQFALGDTWNDAAIDLGTDATWENVFTGETLRGAKLRLADVFRTFPVAWLRAR
jgi:(1->4)-alpha-D-glucan 1-alpha-D-glucosylmutase